MIIKPVHVQEVSIPSWSQITKIQLGSDVNVCININSDKTNIA